MKLETFFNKFDQFADAPHSVEKIRELVLELSVQGKLVEQKPADGDGHALLRQIQKKNPPLVNETDVESVAAELASFPSSWAPSKLGEVAEIIRGVTFPGSAKSEKRSNGDVACLRTASVQAEIDWDDLIYISPSYVSRTDQWVAPNDIMISMANSYALVGKVAIVRQVPQKATFGAFLAAIRPILIEPYFLLYVLRSPRMQAAFRASSSQTTNIANISLGRMRPLPFPLPPLAEQKRIVAKLDELMALCDRLEAQQKERESRHGGIARASLARFADAPTPANLNFIFHKSYDISPADLRKSILTLAVQGKLVPQDPNDEPAINLLSQIADEKRRLIAARIIRPQDEVAPITDDELQFEVPFGWEWARLSSITRRIHYGYTASAKPELNDVRLLRITDIQNNFVDWPSVPGCEIAKDDVAQYQLQRGDILVARTGGTVGKTYLVQDAPVVAVFASYLIRIQGGSLFFDRYLKLFLESPTYWVQLEEGARGAAQPNVNGQTLGRMVVSVPPLAEQRRIVAKVDQLMALVDELETQLAASRTTAVNLLSTLVAELTIEC